FNTTIASVKDGNFLSAGETDFIFAIIGEEMGFRGSVIIILIIGLVVFECLYMAARSKDLSGRLICTGMAALIGFQAFANIAVATQIFPNTGLPLPFISSGVSSLISIFMGMGLVLNVGLQRKIGN
ncbi:MAG: FtsW/RodA/SpoVE family cell cycle protein, partial [Clostridiales bacterium]|nr:FtsW/RodA/SpoVE family cell cycle protein [Clostridiales bacterium]